MIIEYFGLAGCGKSTHLAKIAVSTQRNIDRGLSKYKYVYSNVYVNYPRIRLIEWDFIGLYDYTDCLILIDEVGLNAHCRDHERFPKRLIEWFCTHRHDRCDLIFYAQYYNQADKVIREVTDRLYYMRKSIIFGRTRIVRIPKTIVIPKDTGEIREGYRMPNLFERIFVARSFRRKPYYKYFDSWASYKRRPSARFTVVDGSPNSFDNFINVYLVSPIKRFFSVLSSAFKR